MSEMFLLTQLYAIHAPTEYEWPLISFIREYIREHVPVQEIHSDDFCVKEENGTLYGWSEANQQRDNQRYRSELCQHPCGLSQSP